VWEVNDDTVVATIDVYDRRLDAADLCWSGETHAVCLRS
jgi:hypothetical protein